ncbi:hypothetical protein [Actinophytocola sediminis]
MAVPQRFRYALPSMPVARAAVDIGHLGIRIDLVLTGNLDLVGTGDLSTMDNVRACALKAVRGLASGVMVRGLGSASPAITSTAGHVFTQLRHDFPAATTVAFAGRCEIDFDRRCDLTLVSVRGTTDYSLAVTALATSGRPVAAQANGRNWFVRHDRELASIGMVVLVAVPIAPAGLVAAEGRSQLP